VDGKRSGKTSGRSLLSSDRLDPRQQDLRLKVLGILSRPLLRSSDQERLRVLVDSQDWTPPRHIAAASLLDDLFFHHLRSAGVPAERLFPDPEKGSALREQSLKLGPLYYFRRSLVTQALKAIADAGTGPVMLIKGAALESLYPSPALRQMCDLDVVVPADSAKDAGAALGTLGWTRRAYPASELWQHESGLMIDIHWPHSESDESMLRDAVPHPSAGGGILWPRPGHHLALLSAHAARNCGNRLWRDVCDAQALLSHASGDVCSEALGFAERCGLRGTTASFLAFLGRHCDPPVALPAEVETAADRNLIQLYEEMGVEEASPAALNLLRFTIFRGRGVSGGAAEESGDLSGWAERDPLAGVLPARGSLRRHLLKLDLLKELLLSGRFRHYLRLIRLQQRSYEATRKPFS
jgi:hypothetical protein